MNNGITISKAVSPHSLLRSKVYVFFWKKDFKCHSCKPATPAQTTRDNKGKREHSYGCLFVIFCISPSLAEVYEIDEHANTIRRSQIGEKMTWIALGSLTSYGEKSSRHVWVEQNPPIPSTLQRWIRKNISKRKILRDCFWTARKIPLKWCKLLRCYKHLWSRWAKQMTVKLQASRAPCCLHKSFVDCRIDPHKS